jgi:hypothetical protein
MSKIAVSSPASGTATYTISAPAGSTDRTLTLPDSSGTLQVSGAAISGTTGTFTGLVDISAAGAGQIKFPATQNASANANTLDDYEEGTFTPSLTFGGGSTGLTYSIQQGGYIKVGQLVYCSIQINISNKGINTGPVSVNGLPFSIGGGVSFYCSAVQAYNMQSVFTTIAQFASGTNFELKSSGSDTTLLDSQFTNTSILRMVFVYQATA